MTDPGRYDRPDLCHDCGQPHRGDCPLDWDDDGPVGPEGDLDGWAEDDHGDPR